MRGTQSPKGKKQRNWFALGLLAPAVALLSFTIILPVFLVIGLSLFKYNLLNLDKIQWNDFGNYTAIFQNPVFFQSFGRTLQYVFGTVAVQFVIGLAAALLLNSRLLRLTRVYRTLLFLPWTIPSLVVAVVWMFMYQPQYGVVNYALGLQNLNILGDMGTAMPGVIVAAVWKQMPLMMIMLLSGLQTVPDSLREAANIDGASALQAFRAIVIPCLMPVLKTVTLTSIITNFQMFVLFFTMTGGGPVRATTTLTVYTYETAFTGFNLGRGAAIGVCWLAFLVIFSGVYNKALSAREVEY
ncbi:MAG: sugar ABC transporter permease [Candidatus Limiplasma sp.]|nr:sugar ABC transporter permease [Candidatus Limiplasma sp.]